MFSFFINILEHNENIEECLKKFCTEVKLFDVNLSIIPLFIETKINSTKCNFFHIPVNHHGISESNEFQSLCNLIQKNSFDKSDLLHYHIYIYKKPTKNMTINCEANKCQIIDFKTLPYGKNHYYEFLQSNDDSENFLTFLEKIMNLNLFRHKNRKIFIELYNECIDNFNKNGNNAKAISEKDCDNNSIYEDFDEGYFRLITLFQKRCTFRFGIVEGLHRTSAMLNAIYLSKKSNTYIQSKNRMYITSTSNPNSNNKYEENSIIAKKLKSISHQYMQQKQIVFQNTSTDNLRNLWITMLYHDLFHENNLYINRIPKTTNLNNAKTHNVLHIFEIIRQKVKEILLLKGSNDWCEALIKNENANYLSFFDNDNMEDYVKKMLRSYPSFFYLKPKDYSYTAPDNMALLFDITTRRVRSVVLDYRQFLISECVLLHYFVAASLNKSLGITIKKILFDDRTKYVETQFKITEKKRSFLNLDTLSKFNNFKHIYYIIFLSLTIFSEMILAVIQLIMEPKQNSVCSKIQKEIRKSHRAKKQPFLTDFHKFYAMESLLKSYSKYGDYPILNISSKVVLLALITGVSQFNTVSIQTCYESKYITADEYIDEDMNIDIISDFQKIINSELTVFEILCIFYMIWVRVVDNDIDSLKKAGT